MKRSRKIITIDEFFSLKEMFSGSKEDAALALEIYKNQYTDQDVLDKLMCKALLFKDRVNYSIAVKYTFRIGFYDMKTGNIFAYIDSNKLDNIYNQILNKIIDNDKDTG